MQLNLLNLRIRKAIQVGLWVAGDFRDAFTGGLHDFLLGGPLEILKNISLSIDLLSSIHQIRRAYVF